jgi:hypothetical protein
MLAEAVWAAAPRPLRTFFLRVHTGRDQQQELVLGSTCRSRPVAISVGNSYTGPKSAYSDLKIALVGLDLLRIPATSFSPGPASFVTFMGKETLVPEDSSNSPTDRLCRGGAAVNKNFRSLPETNRPP